MLQLSNRFFLVCLVSAMLFSSACTTSGTNGQAARQAYTNFLVIGVAGDYDSRAHFERSVVSRLRAEGASATAYYTIVGGNRPLDRDEVLAAVNDHGFDAVVITRALGTDTDFDLRDPVTGTKVSRKEGGVLDFFRYDYEELDEPAHLALDMRLTFATELYSAATESLVWSNELQGPNADDMGELIDETAEIVVRQLRRSGRIAR